MDASIVKIKSLSIASIIISTISLFLIICGFYYYRSKGFDISDEAYYLICSNRKINFEYNGSYFGVLNDFFCFGHTSLIDLRTAKFLFQIFASLVFLFSFFKFIKSKKFELDKFTSINVAVGILLVSFCNYDYLPMTLSYNSWSFIFSLICFSLFFLDFVYYSRPFHFVSSVIFGFILFCLFLSKFPNAVILGFLYVVMVLFFKRTNLIIKLLGCIVGLCLAYLVFIPNQNYLIAILQNYYDAVFKSKHTAIGNYFDQLLMFYHVMLKERIILIELVIVGCGLSFNVFIKNRLFIFLPLIANYLFAFSFYKGNQAVLYNDFVFFSILFINAFLFYYTVRADLTIKFDLLFIGFALFSIPFLLMVGTDNLFYYTTSHSVLFAYTASILFVLLNKSHLSSLFLSLQTIMASLFIVAILWNGAVKNPYRQTDLNDKRFLLTFNSDLNGIYENYNRFVDYQKLKWIIQKWNKPMEPIFTYFNYLGIETLTHLKSSTNTVISDGEVNVGSNEFILSKTTFEKLPHMILLPEKALKSRAQIDLLGKFNMRLGVNYHLVYSTTFLSDIEKVYVYIYKNNS